MSHHKNAFDLLRVLLAALVLLSHAYYFTSQYPEPLLLFSKGQANMGAIGVAGFFCLSGYLIMASFSRSPVILTFLQRRFLRIYPAYWVSLIITGFIAAPLLYYLGTGSLTGFPFFGENSALSYVTRNITLLIKQFSIGDVLNYSAYKNSINGSIWSLFPEITCYAFTLVLGVLGLAKGNKQLFLLFFVFTYVVYVANINGDAHFGPTIFTLSTARAIYTCYLCGTCLYIFEDRIKIDGNGILFVALISIVTLRLGGFLIIMPVAMALLTVKGFALFRLNFKYDLSFGLYIYSFPAEHLVFKIAGQQLSFFACVLMSGAIATALAFLSFVCIERPFMQLKNRKIAQHPKK